MQNSDRLLRASHYVTSPFGYRINPVTKKPEGHNGTDYGTSGKKVPCYAIDAGKVTKVSRDRYGANFVYVNFPNLNKYGLYYHLDSVSVKVGQIVTANTQIGIIGKTGQATGVHLHFSLIQANAKAMKYYEADYIDYEKYQFPQNHSENYLQVQKKYGFEDATMEYLEAYKFAEDLFAKMLAGGDQAYQLSTINYILGYKFGADIFKKLGV